MHGGRVVCPAGKLRQRAARAVVREGLPGGGGAYRKLTVLAHL